MRSHRRACQRPRPSQARSAFALASSQSDLVRFVSTYLSLIDEEDPGVTSSEVPGAFEGVVPSIAMFEAHGSSSLLVDEAAYHGINVEDYHRRYNQQRQFIQRLRSVGGPFFTHVFNGGILTIRALKVTSVNFARDTHLSRLAGPPRCHGCRYLRSALLDRRLASP